jgi:Methyltransferase domain
VTPPGPGCCRPRYSVFDERLVQGEVRTYRRNGPDQQSRELAGALLREGLQGATAVDIGAGVGAIGHQLVAAGAAQLTDVDGSPAYLAAAREEAERLGTADRWQFLEGDYVALAGDIGQVDVVTLGRVLCCYEDWRVLVSASTARARRLYGVIYPVSRWWIRAGAAVANAIAGLFTDKLRIYIHPDRQVDTAIRAAGFEPIHQHRGLFWQTVAYRRVAA